MNVIEIILFAAACMLGVPVIVFTVECLAAVFPRRTKPATPPERCSSVCVLIPAHNEETTIARLVGAVKAQSIEGDRVVVVADNCTDNTATLARQTGAEVAERNDTERTGKGYALAHGIEFIRSQPPDSVIILDADCDIGEDTIAELASATFTTARPAQARNLIDLPEVPSSADCVSVLAFRVKNQVRPIGLARLGVPCLLMGTGMAFPWNIIRDARLDTGNIVEDMQLGVDMALQGSPVLYCDKARVTSGLPNRSEAKMLQRKRWEHGHLQTLLAQVPRLLQAGLWRRRPYLLAMALDLSVPPLSLLVMLTTVLFCAAVCSSLLGGWHLPAILSGGYVLAVGVSVLLAWAKYARDTVPLTALLAAPFYALRKIPIYLQFAVRRERNWVRTERNE